MCCLPVTNKLTACFFESILIYLPGKVKIGRILRRAGGLKSNETLADTMRMPVQANKAIVGSNAFSHSSGIHQDGFLKDALCYEIIKPEDVGAAGSKIVLTARSGRSALAHRLRKLGYEFTRNDVDKLYEQFVKIADSKKEVEDNDLLAMAKQYKPEAVVV